MKAKLSKDSDGYWLDISDDGITKRPLTDFGQLSIKNCEAIANGYDLDELAEELTEHFNTFDTVKSDIQVGFKAGFLKALEIFGDKKFSEDDLRLAMHFGKFGETNNQTTTIGFIKSLQQTEWDVEIEMTKDWYDGFKPTPKLDKDGCLILKRNNG